MSAIADATPSTSVPPTFGRRTALAAAMAVAAVAAVLLLVAAMLSLSWVPGDVGIPRPEPAPSPIQPR